MGSPETAERPSPQARKTPVRHTRKMGLLKKSHFILRDTVVNGLDRSASAKRVAGKYSVLYIFIYRVIASIRRMRGNPCLALK